MKTEFTVENFNPDGMNEDELVDWIAFFRDDIAADEKLFGFPPPESCYAQMEWAMDYCREKLLAMRYRRAGLIAEAIRHEHACELIYADIKPPLRW